MVTISSEDLQIIHLSKSVQYEKRQSPLLSGYSLVFFCAQVESFPTNVVHLILH